MYTRNNDAQSGAYAIPSNYGGTALINEETPPTADALPTSAESAAEQPAREALSIADAPASPSRREPGILGMLGGLLSRGGKDGNSDLLLILIAILIFSEDGDVELPLIILAVLLLCR